MDGVDNVGVEVASSPPEIRYGEAVGPLRNWLESRNVPRTAFPESRVHRYIGSSGKEYRIRRDPWETISSSAARGDRVTIVAGDYTNLEVWEYTDFEGQPNKTGTAMKQLSYTRTEAPAENTRFLQPDKVNYNEYGNFIDHSDGKGGELNYRPPGPSRDIREGAEAVDVFAKFEDLQKDLEGATEVVNKSPLEAARRFIRDHKVGLGVAGGIIFGSLAWGGLTGTMTSIQNLDAWNAVVNVAATYAFGEASSAGFKAAKEGLKR